MSGIFEHILPSLLIHRYTALFAVSFLSCIGLPLPAAPSTVAAAAFASQGYLNITAVILVASIGNILGDLTLYALVRVLGIRVLHLLRLQKLLDTPAFENVEETVEKYKAPVLILSRFQNQATVVVNVICGLGKMKLRKFATYIIFGEVLQIVVYSSIGYIFADSWEAIYNVVGKFGWLVALVTTTVVILLSKKILKRVAHKKLS